MSDLLDAARGRWPDLLAHLAGLSFDQLTDEHQPCPLCGGTDRYRFDDIDGNGTWFCNQCGGPNRSGGAGNGLDLLMRKTGWDFATAAQRIEGHLGITPKRRGKPHRIPDRPPRDALPPPLGRATAQWCYRDAQGHQLFWMQRLDLPATSDKPARKVFIHRVWLDGGWHYPRSRGPQADPFTCEWPAPRPLYGLPDLIARPDDPVLLVEGEKCRDRAADLFPQTVVLSWSNGAKAVSQVDWAPLAGRRVTLWPDNDQDGRSGMARAADRLRALGCQLRVVLPPDDLPHGWDIADASDWTADDACAFAAAHIQDLDTQFEEITLLNQPTAPPPPPPPTDPAPVKPAPGGYFTPLGFDNDGYYYQPQGTGQVVRLSRASHTGTNLVALAPLEYWETMHPSKTGVNWTAAASALFQQQAAVGVYSPDRIRGRGAWWDSSRAVLHLGDRLLVDGADHRITQRLPNSPYLYQRLAAIEGLTGIEPLTTIEATRILDIAERFHWEVPASGWLIAGWATLAPICGALEWRPHVWLTAGAGSGKSTLLDRFLGPLLGPLSLWPEGNTTEAFIRQELRADAIPVVFDEAESNEKPDQQRIQAILSLARVASSSGRGVIGKGSADGTSQRFTIRSMFLLSSISTALKQGADKSRFAQLTMRNPTDLPKADRTSHWEALDHDLDHHITEDIGRRLLARTIGLIPVIRASARVFRSAAADAFDSQRLGDQYGTLLAGAWSLMSSEVPTKDQAIDLIASQDWDPYQQSTEIPDEVRCIQAILQHQLRVELDHSAVTRTIGELVAIAGGDPQWEISSSLAEATLGRHGLRVEDQTLLVSNTAQAIGRILADTPWSFSWATILSRLPGATKAGVVRFKGLGATSRAVRIPLASL